MDANIGIFDAAVTAVVGYAVVFLGLAILMWLVILVFCVGGVALLSLTGRKKKK